jgi:hypothetical protein
MDEQTFLDYCCGHVQLGIGRGAFRQAICDVIQFTKARQFNRIVRDLEDPKNFMYINFKARKNGKRIRPKSK